MKEDGKGGGCAGEDEKLQKLCIKSMTEPEFWVKGGDFIVSQVQWFQPLTLLLFSY